MTYSEAIKSGFRLVNDRWQLVAVHAAVMLFNCLGFFIMVGIPLGIAFIIFGLDLTGLAEIREVLGVLKNPSELISKYFGLVLVVITSFLLYILMVTTIWLYVFSGSVGILGQGILEPSRKFSMRAFFSEARRLFFPLMWFSLFICLIFIAIAFVLGLFGGGIAAVTSAARSQDSTLALFLGIFFSLVLILVGLSIIFGALSVTIYGIAILFFKGEGAIRSFQTAVKFLWSHQNAFWIYVLLLSGYILVSFALMLVIYPFNLIPIIGTIISLPFQILSYIVQGYLGLVVVSIIFIYYYDSEINKQGVEKVPEPGGDITAGSSNRAEDTSVAQAASQETTLPEKAAKEET